jgi:hypothetical protein
MADRTQQLLRLAPDLFEIRTHWQSAARHG